jgi:hypothetical protein
MKNNLWIPQILPIRSVWRSADATNQQGVISSVCYIYVASVYSSNLKFENNKNIEFLQSEFSFLNKKIVIQLGRATYLLNHKLWLLNSKARGTIKNFPNKIFAAQSVAKKQQMILCSKKFSLKKNWAGLFGI